MSSGGIYTYVRKMLHLCETEMELRCALALRVEMDERSRLLKGSTQEEIMHVAGIGRLNSYKKGIKGLKDKQLLLVERVYDGARQKAASYVLPDDGWLPPSGALTAPEAPGRLPPPTSRAETAPDDRAETAPDDGAETAPDSSSALSTALSTALPGLSPYGANQESYVDAIEGEASKPSEPRATGLEAVRRQMINAAPQPDDGPPTSAYVVKPASEVRRRGGENIGLEQNPVTGEFRFVNGMGAQLRGQLAERYPTISLEGVLIKCTPDLEREAPGRWRGILLKKCQIESERIASAATYRTGGAKGVDFDKRRRARGL